MLNVELEIGDFALLYEPLDFRKWSGRMVREYD
jgi:hypothetical protein